MMKKVISLIITTIMNNFIRREVDYSTWVFSSSYNSKFNYNSKYLFEYVLENEPNITPLYVINNDNMRKDLQKKYGEKYFIETNSVSGINKALNAGVWFTSAGLPVYGLGLGKKRTIVNLWHGVPLKRIALMEKKISKWKKVYFKYIFSNNYTYVLTTSRTLVPIMKESFDVPISKIKIWGQPRNDAIFIENNREKVLSVLYDDLPYYKKTILYAPTFRNKSATKFFPFEDFEPIELNDFLEKNELIIFIRCHQSELNNIKNNYGDRVRLINSNKVEEIMDIINIFDLLLTDYSSIYIDYLLTERPVIFLPYDKETYLKNRGLNFDYDEITPGPKPDTFKSFKIEVFKLLNDASYYRTERNHENNLFNEVNYKCSSRICKEIKEKLSL